MVNKKVLKPLLTLSAVALFITVIGNACGQFKPSDGGVATTSLAQCTSSQDFKTIPGAQTVGIVYGDQVLENMQACTAVLNLSQNTLDEHEARKASFSQYGYVGDVTSAMMMGVAALGVEVCADLVDQERTIASTQRRIFNAVDMASTGLNNNAIDETLERMSRSCWGRVPTAEEKAILQEEMLAMGSVSNELKAIGICASVLASLDGIRQ